ncbi:MAG TPA: FtsQ-type POTRA domain-containing protein [bacterium]|nr:FtsQ-type POTRA domain-containing protein [bacterium]
MHYRGKRVPLSERSPLFQRAGIPSRPSVVKRTEEKKHFFAWPQASQEKGEKERQVSGSFYRPGRSAEATGFYRAPVAGTGPVEPAKGRGSRGSWLRLALRLSALGLLIGVLVWSKERTVSLLQDMAGLKLEKVMVEGNRFLAADEVVKTVALPLGESMFKLDLKSATERVRAMDWVQRVFIERRLPRSILVTIKERRPVALLEKGDLYGVDAQGRVLPPAPLLMRQDLPLISGLDFPAEAVGTTEEAEALGPALDFLAFLGKKDPALAQDVSEVNLSDADSLKVTFMDGLQARFDPPVSETELERMALVVSDLQEKGRKAATMDFRYRGLVLVKPRL